MIGAEQLSPHITELLDSSCINLFRDIDRDIKKVDGSIGLSDSLTAYINADSSDLSIALLLSIPKPLLSQLLPANEVNTCADENALNDSILELSNQLLGKLKNQLVSQQCRLNMGLPKLCFNAESEPLLSAQSDKRKLFYEIDNNLIECLIAVDIINKDIMINPSNEEIDTDIDDGELELF